MMISRSLQLLKASSISSCSTRSFLNSAKNQYETHKRSSAICLPARDNSSFMTGNHRSGCEGKKPAYLMSQQRNYVVLFHPAESGKKKLTQEEEELAMELEGVEGNVEEEVFSDGSEKFDDVRFDFSSISYDNYLPGGNEIRGFLQEDENQRGGRRSYFHHDHSMTTEDQQEVDTAIGFHGCDENYGYRLEHEKRKDKRRRIANRSVGRRSSRKVHAMVEYLEMKKQYTSTAWGSRANREDRDEKVEEEDDNDEVGASTSGERR